MLIRQSEVKTIDLNMEGSKQKHKKASKISFANYFQLTGPCYTSKESNKLVSLYIIWLSDSYNKIYTF